MDKIKEFFQNKIVRTVLWVLLCLCSVCLIIGGAIVETISSGVALVGGIVTAVLLLLTFIAEQVKK